MRARALLAAVAAASLAAGCAAPSGRVAAAAVSAPDRGRIPPLGPPPALELPAQRHFRLGNGLAVRLVEYRRLPIVALHLVLDAGAAHDPAGRPGLASFTAAMVTEGTRSRTSTQISDEVGFLGASLAAGAGFDAAYLSATTLSRHLAKLLDVFADVAQSPSFPEPDFARVQDQRRVALVQQRDSPQAVGRMAFAAAFWGDHPYGHWIQGTEASVAATRREDLAGFHRRFWRPERAELVVVGDVGEAELRPLVEASLGRWPAGEAAPAPRPAAPAGPARTVLIEKQGAPQSYVVMGMPGVPRTSPEWIVSEVAFQILGGGNMSSRLMRNLRETHGYTYGVDARADARRLGGASVIGGSFKTDVTGAAVREVLAEVERMRRDLVSPGELADAKRGLVLSLPFDFATAAGIAGRLAEASVYGLPDDWWNRYAASVQRVTAEEVRDFARRHLDPARLVTVMVCEVAAVRPQLEGLPLGAVEVRPSPAAAGGAVGSGR